MKAIVYRAYGPPDVLELAEIEQPTAGADEVLIEVRAAAVNPLDWHYVRGSPYFIRLLAGLRRPKVTRLGVDVAGRVEAVGVNVRQFKPGDEVFGGCRGAFAEYACASERALVLKPGNVTFEQAAAAPVAAYTALQSLRDHGRLQSGQQVLINGAAGGVGTFAVQIAKTFGTDVTGVCSTRNVDMVRSLGADRVIDYTREDFTKGTQRYDVIFDCAGSRSLSAYRRVLKPKGICVVAAGPDGAWLGPLSRFITALALSPFVSQKLTPFIARIIQADLVILRELILAGKVTPVIDKCYKLSEAGEAIAYLEKGHARGKVIVTLPDE